jgi:hypothetical protein
MMDALRHHLKKARNSAECKRQYKRHTALFLFRIWEDEPFESLIEFCTQAFVLKNQIKIMLRKPLLKNLGKN